MPLHIQTVVPSRVVKASGDIKLCNGFPDNQKLTCVEKLAVSKKDASICKDAEGKDSQGTQYKDYCYFYTAYATKKPSYCDNIQNKDMINSCKSYSNQQNSTTQANNIQQQEPNGEQPPIKEDNSFKEKCILSAGFVCQDFKIHPSAIEITLINQLGYPIKLHNIKVKNCESSIEKNVDYGAPTLISISNCDNGRIGDIFYGDASYEFLTAIDQKTHSGSGVINAKIT